MIENHQTEQTTQYARATQVLSLTNCDIIDRISSTKMLIHSHIKIFKFRIWPQYHISTNTLEFWIEKQKQDMQ